MSENLTTLFPKCSIEPCAGGYSLLSPYNPEFVAAFKSAVPSTARVWDKTAKRWFIDINYAPIVAQLIAQHYGEQITIPAPQLQPQIFQSLELRVEYVGVCKEREDGSKSAFGFYNEGWNVVFPETVLRAYFKDLQDSILDATYYGALGIDRKAKPQEIKSAYRLMARQWHPDLCSEPDAAQKFHEIDTAYKLLSNPLRRKKYDAGLKFEESLQRQRKRHYPYDNYRTPLRSGLVLIDGHQVLSRIVVDEIHAWTDILNEQGQVHVASWPRGWDTFKVSWVNPGDDEPDFEVPF